MSAPVLITALFALTGCSREPPKMAPRQITIGVAVPLSGPGKEAGDALVRGVRLAAGDAFAVLVNDDTQPGSAERLARIPEVMGAVAHVTRGAAEAQAADWLRERLPAILAAPGAYTGLPRVVPPLSQLASCATKLIGEGPYVLRTDGSGDALSSAATVKAALPQEFKGQSTLAPMEVATEAAKFRDRTEQVVYLGDPKLGGNLLRAVRAFSSAAFLAVSAEDPEFLAAAGAAAEGARVTGATRPARDPGFVEAYRQKYGDAPDGNAVDGYDAARLLIAAWQTAHGRNPSVTRSAVAEALPGVVAIGSGGSMHLDAGLILQPVECQAYVVRDGRFVRELSASTADEPVQDPAGAPVIKPAVRRKKRAEGEWLGLPPASHEGDPVQGPGSEPIRTPGVRRP